MSTSISIRRSGGANIISLPKKILSILNLDVGSKLIPSIQDDAILLTPAKQDEMTLESLLEGSPKSCFIMNDEDREWLDVEPVGKEII